jgi:uncharacterized protein (TIGR03435 family)
VQQLSETAVLTAVLATLASAQTAPRRFDVASVKAVAGQNPGGYRHDITPTSLTMRGVSMGYCIRLAYGIPVQRPWELVGPSWLNPPTEFVYDILARTDTPSTEDQIRQMLRQLLADRFALTIHEEQRTLPAFALHVPWQTPALRPSTSTGEPKLTNGEKPHEYVFQRFSMADLARQLGPPATSRPVLDRSALPGRFDFRVDLAPYVLDANGSPILDARGAIDTETAFMKALRDQLGINLTSDRGEFQVLVVDHVEKKPTPD